MNDDQMSKMVMDNARDIAALKQGHSALEKRIDENDRVTTGIHKLAANTENLATEVKRLGERLEAGLREQGKRVGEVETAIIKFGNMESSIKLALTRLDAIEKEPATKWKTLVAQVTALVIAAVAGVVIAKFM